MRSDAVKYQLVLQWSLSPDRDFDFLVEIEDLLIESLSNLHEVDGHDIGSGEGNVFILTNNPLMAFDEVKMALKDSPLWSDLKVAYRGLQENEYRILYPEGLTTFSIQ